MSAWSTAEFLIFTSQKGENSIDVLVADENAKRRIPMTMEDWVNRLNAFLKFNEYEKL